MQGWAEGREPLRVGGETPVQGSREGRTERNSTSPGNAGWRGGAGKVQQGLVVLLGAISLPRAGLFFGALSAQGRFREEGHRPPERRASREGSLGVKSGERQEWAEQGPRTQAGGSGGGAAGLRAREERKGDMGEGPS